MNNTSSSSFYFLHNSGLLMEFLFKKYCIIRFFLSKGAFNRDTKVKNINFEILI